MFVYMLVRVYSQERSRLWNGLGLNFSSLIVLKYREREPRRRIVNCPYRATMTLHVPVTKFTRTASALVALTLLLPVAVICYLLRTFVVRPMVKLKFGTSADLVLGQDCSTFFEAMRNHDSILNLLMEIDGRVSLEQLKQVCARLCGASIS